MRLHILVEGCYASPIYSTLRFYTVYACTSDLLPLNIIIINFTDRIQAGCLQHSACASVSEHSAAEILSSMHLFNVGFTNQADHFWRMRTTVHLAGFLLPKFLPSREVA